MANPLFNGLGNNPMAMLSQLRSNPLGLLKQFGFNVPANVNGPDAIIQYLMNSGLMSQEQYNQLQRTASQIQSNPQFMQFMGRR